MAFLCHGFLFLLPHLIIHYHELGVTTPLGKPFIVHPIPHETAFLPVVGISHSICSFYYFQNILQSSQENLASPELMPTT